MTEPAPAQTDAPLALRPHTILGVCEGLGEDFGFNPTYLRVALAVMVLWHPSWAFAAYFLLGGLVLVSRFAFPDKAITPNAPEIVLAIEDDEQALDAELSLAA